MPAMRSEHRWQARRTRPKLNITIEIIQQPERNDAPLGRMAGLVETIEMNFEHND